MAYGFARASTRRFLGITLSLAVAAAVFFLRRWGVLDGIPALVFGFVLASLLPWSTSLSRRILLAGAIFLGWVPVMWWVRLPVPQVDRMGLLLAVTCGTLVAWVLWAPGARERMKRLVPRLMPVDVVMFGALLLAAWTVWPLLSSTSGEDTLSALVGQGYDHISHSAMALQIRAQGASLPFLASPPDGGHWSLLLYPQHFHSSIAALTELYSGTVVGDASTEILGYGRSLALMQVVTAVLLTAGIAQLPNLRRRPVFAWPIAAMVLSAFLFGTGSWAFSMGWENFIWACALVGLATLLAVSMSGEFPRLGVFALGGLVIATAHAWILLVPLAAVAACASLLPWKDSPLLESHRNRFATGLVASVTLAVSGAVVFLIKEDPEGLGGILATEAEWVPHGVEAISPLILTVGMAIATALAAYVRRREPEYATKGLGLAAVPTVGLLSLAVIGVYQLVKIGQLSYYFDKLVWGVGLASVVVLAAALALLVDPVPTKRAAKKRTAAIVASVAATAAALQLFGWSGLDYRDWSKTALAEHRLVGRRILKATGVAGSYPFASTVYLAAMPGDAGPVLSDIWHHGLNYTWSSSTHVTVPVLNSLVPDEFADIGRVTAVAQELLELERGYTVIVAPEILAEIRAGLPEEMGARVVSWE